MIDVPTPPAAAASCKMDGVFAVEQIYCWRKTMDKLCRSLKKGVPFPISLLGVFRSIGSGGNNPRNLKTVLQRWKW